MAKFLLHNTFFLFSICFLILFIDHSSERSIQNPVFIPSSAHKELQTNGFPIGLLPKNVLNYALNKTSGDFSVNLGYTCKLTLPPDNYEATYSKKITGKLVEGKAFFFLRQAANSRVCLEFHHYNYVMEVKAANYSIPDSFPVTFSATNKGKMA
ncbi:hypothetical protein MKW98_011307 [Papaver atlanticum]|uniref:Uncharacterized protein n=1 Tax=Papaver atlanticum TaxID=357466 RepID=A0AAD4SVU5_9MAGN|nr:hypothetical protein MKW98_011307 [Papaver atlanticum]